MAEERIRRRVRRAPLSEVEYVNTINVRDRVTIDFVWYPGSPMAAQSRIDPTVPNHPRTGEARSIRFTWAPRDRAPVTRVMNSGSITISLPPGSSGVLTAFETAWEIRRAARGVQMTPVDQMRGVQQRLNRLGYHLRAPGAIGAGIEGIWGRRTEIAVLQFQNDYVPPHGAPPAAANQLRIRGEWTQNTNAAYVNNIAAYHCGTCPNPSSGDGNALRAALRARVGS